MGIFSPAAVIRGKALIFWDPKVPGQKRKLDAIDTDQITPASDCVSESLETLDARWKEGAFRYLMPDFRSRVHQGETFVVAGDDPGDPAHCGGSFRCTGQGTAVG